MGDVSADSEGTSGEGVKGHNGRRQWHKEDSKGTSGKGVTGTTCDVLADSEGTSGKGVTGTTGDV
jgi:hypothetical protein